MADLKQTLIAVSAIRWLDDDIPSNYRAGAFPFDPRALDNNFGGDSFRQLKSSIEKHGQLNPIFVVKSEKAKEPGRGLVVRNEPYTVLVGHYRLWACIAMGKKVVSAVVVDWMADIAKFYGITE